jgi:hypothetical protein
MVLTSVSYVADLTLPLVDEKAALPAIIVTPSSPSGDTDFSIAFLAPPPSPPLLQRVSTAFKLKKSPQLRYFSQVKARTALLLFLPLVLLVCHLLTHQLATLRPRLNFDTHAHLQYPVAAPETNSRVMGNVHAARVGMNGFMEGRGEQELRIAEPQGLHHDST